MDCGLVQPGGKFVEPSSSTCRLLLTYVPTIGVGDITLPSLSRGIVPDQKVVELADEKSPKIPTANDIVLAEVR
jgi:hypothetical protein